MKDSKVSRLLARLPFREVSIAFAFIALTALMTWLWVLHLRDAVPDPSDPYLNAWTMWWDYYQTFHDPVNLFHAPIFYPNSYTLAYSEHNYGIALLFFPFYALGLRPLTSAGLATILGFAFSGYGAFRMARTLTGCSGFDSRSVGFVCAAGELATRDLAGTDFAFWRRPQFA